jgi:hypothetical protein
MIPTRGEIVAFFEFLGELTWPHEKKYVVIFNEPNQASEWEGMIDPASYAQTLSFAADWAHTEGKNYQVLPAGLDLAAPNGKQTMEAFSFLEKMWESESEVFDKIDYWNSHSYPNPSFSAAANKTGQNSLRGFEQELSWLKKKTGRELKVFITETGWQENQKTRAYLNSYYEYASKNIWSDERVVAVTPFVLKGDPGPFSLFTFIDQDGTPTRQYEAYANQIKRVAKLIKQEQDALAISNF